VFASRKALLVPLFVIGVKGLDGSGTRSPLTISPPASGWMPNESVDVLKVTCVPAETFRHRGI
jgi:hypothetical protein